jgi:hypothetical protein
MSTDCGAVGNPTLRRRRSTPIARLMMHIEARLRAQAVGCSPPRVECAAAEAGGLRAPMRLIQRKYSVRFLCAAVADLLSVACGSGFTRRRAARRRARLFRARSITCRGQRFGRCRSEHRRAGQISPATSSCVRALAVRLAASDSDESLLGRRSRLRRSASHP